MKKWLLALPAGALAGGYWGFQQACKRPPEPDWTSEAALKQTPFAEFAESIPRALQWLHDHNAQEVRTTSFDGLLLRGKWVPAKAPRATIILFHGYHSHYLNDFAGIFSLYHSIGLNLLLVRQRSHGESGGKYITFGVRERKDVQSWVEFHNRTHGMDNVFLGGMSMGASTVLFAAGEDLPPNVRGITADCGFSSPAEILGHIIRQDYHLPPKLVLPLMEVWARTLGGFSFYECDSRKILAQSKIPVVFIHGTGDTFVPCSMSQAGCDACASQREIHLIEGAGHGRGYLFEPERLTKALVDFFNRNISDEYRLEG